MRTEVFPSRADALAAEALTIRGERPVHNITVPSGSGAALPIEVELAERLEQVGAKHRAAEAERDRLITEAVRAGGSLRKVAALVGLSHVSVLKIVQRAKPDALDVGA